MPAGVEPVMTPAAEHDEIFGSERESGEVLILRGFLKGTHSAQNCLPNSTVSPKCLKIEGSLWK